MRRHLFRLMSIGVLAAASVAASGCAEPDGYYGSEPEYEGPVYEAPPAVYYDAPAYHEHEHWRHEREEHERHEHEDDD